MVLDKNEFESVDVKDITVASALKETVSGGRVGSLKVDPASLTMGTTSSLLLYLSKTYFNISFMALVNIILKFRTRQYFNFQPKVLYF